jgi:SAM-dependent methyltransferase
MAHQDGAGPVDQDAVNREVWDHDVHRFVHLIGFLDPGEEAALRRVADDVRGRPVLDLGVGAGRTTGILRLLTDDYLGVDYTPAMVAACRRRHPREHFEVADARDLSALATRHFALAFFPFNGLDAVGHGDRLAVLGEVRRVLRPGGWFVFNSHNFDGPSMTDRPWRLRPLSPLPLRHAVYQALRRVVELPWSVANFRRLDAARTDGASYALRPSSSHRFGILVYFTEPGAQVDALYAAGFDHVELMTAAGTTVSRDDDTSGDVWLYYLARTPR